MDAHAELTKLNGDLADSGCSALYSRIREFATGEKVGGAAADCQQIRLSQNLQDLLLFERLNRCCQIQVGTEQEDVQQIVESSGERVMGEVEGGLPAKLPGGNCSDGICRPGADDVERELRSGRAIDVGKADLKQNLRFGFRNFNVQQVDDFTQRGCDGGRAIGRSYIVYGASQEHRSVAEIEVDILARELPLQFAANRVRPRIVQRDMDIEDSLLASQVPQNQAGVSGCFAIDEDFRFAYRYRFSDFGVCYRDALDARRVLENVRLIETDIQL